MTEDQDLFSDLEDMDQDNNNDEPVEEPQTQPTEPDEPEPDTSEPETTTDDKDTDDEPTETMNTETITTPNTTTEPDTTEDERSWRETPAFPHDTDIDHTTLYARSDVIDELDDLIFDVEYTLRREHDLSNITAREIHDALIRQADADDIADQVRDDREQP